MPTWIPALIMALGLEVTIIVAVIGFRVGIEKRFSECLKVDKYESSCEKRDAVLHHLLADVRRVQDENELRASNTRHALQNTVAAMRTEVAIGNKMTEVLDKNLTSLTAKVDTTTATAAAIAAVALAQSSHLVSNR